MTFSSARRARTRRMRSPTGARMCTRSCTAAAAVELFQVFFRCRRHCTVAHLLTQQLTHSWVNDFFAKINKLLPFCSGELFPEGMVFPPIFGTIYASEILEFWILQQSLKFLKEISLHFKLLQFHSHSETFVVFMTLKAFWPWGFADAVLGMAYLLLFLFLENFFEFHEKSGHSLHWNMPTELLSRI